MLHKTDKISFVVKTRKQTKSFKTFEDANQYAKTLQGYSLIDLHAVSACGESSLTAPVATTKNGETTIISEFYLELVNDLKGKAA